MKLNTRSVNNVCPARIKLKQPWYKPPWQVPARSGDDNYIIASTSLTETVGV